MFNFGAYLLRKLYFRKGYRKPRLMALSAYLGGTLFKNEGGTTMIRPFFRGVFLFAQHGQTLTGVSPECDLQW